MIIPTSEADLSRIIAQAEAPFRIQGGGTRPIGAFLGGTSLSTSALTGITLYDPGALTLVVRAGTPSAEVEAALEAEGQRLAFEPMDHRPLLSTTGTPTIGGIVAGNVSGPRRIQVGACRDHLLGVRFVDGQGRIVKNGGRVMKNVTGYDLVKLMAGSFGTLGVLTEVSLKVLPKTHHTGVLRLQGLPDDDAVKALSAALGSPFEVTGAAHLQRGSDGAPVTIIRIEGSEASVDYRAGELRKILSGFGSFGLETDADRTRRCWLDLRDVTAFQDVPGDVWRLSVKPSDAPGIVAALRGVQAIYDWGGGLIWLLVPPDSGGASDEVRQAVAGAGGHATLIRGGATAPAFHPPAPALATLQHGIRSKFDPRQILNPGLMGQMA